MNKTTMTEEQRKAHELALLVSWSQARHAGYSGLADAIAREYKAFITCQT